jgi:hypothetical protein
MERLKKLSGGAPEQVAKAVSVVADFKQWIKTPSNGIAVIDNWNEAFKVRRKKVADATCPKFRPEDGTTCTKRDYKALLPGKVYRLMDSYAEKLSAWGDLATANVKKFTDDLTFTEKIDCKLVCACVVLLGQTPLFGCLVSGSHRAVTCTCRHLGCSLSCLCAGMILTLASLRRLLYLAQGPPQGCLERA